MSHTFRAPRPVHYLCASLVERSDDSAADLGLDLLAGAPCGVPPDRQVRVQIGLELAGQRGQLLRAADVEPFAAGQELGMGVMDAPAVGNPVTEPGCPQIAVPNP